MSCLSCLKATARFTGLFFAKVLVLCASLFFLAGSIFLFWVGGYYNKHEIATELGINQQILIGAVSVGILLFFNFMLVLPIVFTADKIFSRLFTIMSFFFAIVFFVYGGVVLKGKQQIYDYVKSECDNPIGVFGDYDRIHTIAEFYMCSDVCKCNADPSKWNEYPDVQSRMQTSASGITTISDCQPYQNYVKNEGLGYDQTLRAIEQYFDCSGVCRKSHFYSFTDVTLGPPQANCVDRINEYAAQYSSIMAGISIAVGVLLMLGVVGSMIIICCISTKIKITAISTYKYEIMEDNVI